VQAGLVSLVLVTIGLLLIPIVFRAQHGLFRARWGRLGEPRRIYIFPSFSAGVWPKHEAELPTIAAGFDTLVYTQTATQRIGLYAAALLPQCLCGSPLQLAAQLCR
jgi:hypothetical protein